jgi:uncharacterized membrane protein YeaQ/YmgE (transglycosylase-associated protein family)
MTTSGPVVCRMTARRTCVTIFWIALLGLTAGVIARLVAPGRKGPFGFVLTATLGVVGAFAAAALGAEGGWYDEGDPISLIVGLVGAVATLVLWGAFFKSRRPTSSI